MRPLRLDPETLTSCHYRTPSGSTDWPACDGRSLEAGGSSARTATDVPGTIAVSSSHAMRARCGQGRYNLSWLPRHVDCTSQSQHHASFAEAVCLMSGASFGLRKTARASVGQQCRCGLVSRRPHLRAPCTLTGEEQTKPRRAQIRD